MSKAAPRDKKNAHLKWSIWQCCALSVAAIYAIFDNNIDFVKLYIILNTFFLVYVFSTKSANKLNLYSLFLLIFLVSSIILYYVSLYSCNLPFIFSDELGFLQAAFGRSSDGVPNVDWPGYYLFLNFLGGYLGGVSFQSFMCLKLISVFVGAFSLLFVYDISLFFKDARTSKNIAILMGFIPYYIFLSSVLLRDILIMSMTLYIILCLLKYSDKHKLGYILKILIVIVTMSTFRIENALFMTFFLLIFLIYTHFSIRDMSYRAILIFLIAVGSVSVIYFLCFNKGFYKMYLDTYQRYFSYAETSASEDSFGMIIKQFTFPLNMLTTFAFSQIVPFPFWDVMEESCGRLLEGLGGMVWFVVWPFALLSLFIKKIRRIIDNRLIFLFFVAVSYCMLISIIQPKMRTMIYFYPVILIFASYSFTYFSRLKRYFLFVFTYLMYALLYPIYYFLKL